MSERIADYRDLDEIADVCPVCGAPVERVEQRGVWYVSGPADLEAAKKYGIATEGPVTTIWWAWSCSVDFSHYWGPVLVGASNQESSQS